MVQKINIKLYVLESGTEGAGKIIIVKVTIRTGFTTTQMVFRAKSWFSFLFT